jgi:SH3 domain protein
MPGRLASLAASAALLGALHVAAPASARQSWVKGDVLLNVRTGPGVEHRPLGAITTGDPVEVLEHGEGWTRVRSEKSGEGWIPSGFLQDEPPAVVRLQEVESEAAQLRKRVEELAAEAERLRGEHAQSATLDAERAREIERLAEENAALQSDVIWPVMVTGASILLTGALLGAWLRGAGGRRPGTRVRL